MKPLTMLLIIVSICSLGAIQLKAGPITERPADSAGSLSNAPTGEASELLRLTTPCDPSGCSHPPAAVVRAVRSSPDSVARVVRNMTGRMMKALKRLM
jgi:hypothetical protein